jgi:hypothetical protein
VRHSALRVLHEMTHEMLLEHVSAYCAGPPGAVQRPSCSPSLIAVVWRLSATRGAVIFTPLSGSCGESRMKYTGGA